MARPYTWVITIPALLWPLAAASAASLPRERECALVVQICESAWKEAEGAEFDRTLLLAPLAAVDAGRAERLVETLPEAQRPQALAVVIRGLLRVDGKRALLLLAKVPDDAGTLGLLLEAGTALAPDEPGPAKGLLERALLLVRRLGEAERMSSRLLNCAALAKRLGDPRAAELQSEALAAVPELARKAVADKAEGRWGWVQGYAFRLAPTDPEAAVKLLAQITDAEERRRQGMMLVSFRLARADPARALAVLDADPPQAAWDDSTLSTWCESAWKTAAALAGRDAAAALALARRIPRSAEQALALAAVARGLGPEQAAALRREIVDAPVEETEPVAWLYWRRAVQLAALMPPGGERRALCARALGLSFQGPFPMGSDGECLAHAAFLLAPSDPDGARALLEDGLASFGASGGMDSPRSANERRANLALAFVALDPERAVAAARSLPDAQTRLRALQQIALVLAAPPEARANLTLEGLLSARYRLPEEDLP